MAGLLLQTSVKNSRGIVWPTLVRKLSSKSIVTSSLDADLFRHITVGDGHTKVDTSRGKRTGVPEAIYTSGKRMPHVRDIMKEMAGRRRNHESPNVEVEPVIATRCSEEVFQFCSKP